MLTILNADRATLFVVDENRHELWSYAGVDQDIGTIRVAMDSGLAGECARTGRTIIIDDAYADARFDKSVDKVRRRLCVRQCVGASAPQCVSASVPQCVGAFAPPRPSTPAPPRPRAPAPNSLSVRVSARLFVCL